MIGQSVTRTGSTITETIDYGVKILLFSSCNNFNKAYDSDNEERNR